MAAPTVGADGENPMGHSKETTMCFLGCGSLGLAILSGILDNLASSGPSSTSEDTPSESSSPSSLQPTRFIACVRSPSSAQRITATIPQLPQHPVSVVQNDNVSAVATSSIILLGCKPYMVNDILGVPGMREALAGKLLISILAGVTVDQIEMVLYGSATTDVAQIQREHRCRIVRAMPNTAAILRESMTVIGTSTPPLTPSQSTVTTWIFTAVGRVTHLAPSLMDVSTALCGSSPAFIALMLDALADGAVAMGLPRADAQLMSAQAMRGASAMVLNGEHPALVRDKICTPGGCTIGGMLVLEEAGVRGSIAKSVREATVVAGLLGTGAKGVNGTRH